MNMSIFDGQNSLEVYKKFKCAEIVSKQVSIVTVIDPMTGIYLTQVIYKVFIYGLFIEFK